MNEQLIERFFENGIPEEAKNRVLDILVLPDFSSHDDALKIHVIFDELIPDSLTPLAEVIPNVFEGHPIEVFERPSLFEGFRKKSMPSSGARYHQVLRPGVACGGRGTTNGTLGAIVFDLSNGGAPCVLSNYHVLRGIRGINRRWTTDIFQPGKLIGGTPARNVIAKFNRSAGQNIDAAIATLNTVRPFNPLVYPTNIQFSGVRTPKKGDILEKSGSRTEVTRAQVSDVSVKRVELEPIGGDRYNAPEISKSGDSGSVWYYPGSGEAAVLHAYGDEDISRGVEWAAGYVMTEVVKALNISMTSP